MGWRVQSFAGFVHFKRYAAGKRGGDKCRRLNLPQRTILLLQRTKWAMVGWNRSTKDLKSMSNNNDQAWNTKYGPRRVRHEKPTLEEAIIAAQGLSDDLEAQVEIAASLMGLPHDQVRAELLKAAPPRKDVIRSVAFTGPASAPRTFVVERKPARRVMSAR